MISARRDGRRTRSVSPPWRILPHRHDEGRVPEGKSHAAIVGLNEEASSEHARLRQGDPSRPLAAPGGRLRGRQPGNVNLSFDPFSDTPYTVYVPLFIVVSAALILGVLIGGIATWLGRAATEGGALHRRDVERLRSELDRMRGTSSAP